MRERAADDYSKITDACCKQSDNIIKRNIAPACSRGTRLCSGVTVFCRVKKRFVKKRLFGVSRWMGEALVYFFGSYASGLKTATSDCDIVFIPEEVPGVELICKLLSCVAAVHRDCFKDARPQLDASPLVQAGWLCHAVKYGTTLHAMFLFCLFLSCFPFAFFISLQE